MIKNIAKLFINPRRNVPLAFRLSYQYLSFCLQKKMCLLFQNTTPFFQGQMDINPKSRWYNKKFIESTGGYYPKGSVINRQICNLESGDNTRRDMFVLLLRTIIDNKIEGDIAELGVYRGVTAKLFHYYAPERTIHLFDTFEGFTKRGVVSEKENTNMQISAALFSDTSVDAVKNHISQKNNNIQFYKGFFPDTITPSVKEKKFSFVHLDADLYQPIIDGLAFFYQRMNPCGIMVIHDYNSWPGARKAVDEFFSDKNEMPLPMPDRSGSVVIVKQ
ncbi:MAG: O-methyltransferase [Psychroserpens sp.]|jgi:O-methyltransferase